MTAGVWTPTATTRAKILNGTFDFTNDSFKVALFTSSSNLSTSSTTKAGVTNEVANANGYTTGGPGSELYYRWDYQCHARLHYQPVMGCNWGKHCGAIRSDL
jgi:hypothetical protein